MPEDLICGCGSRNFNLRSGGKMACADCQKEISVNELQKAHDKGQDEMAKSEKEVDEELMK